MATSINMTNTLYKKDSKGKIRQWVITSHTDGRLVVETGLVDGKMVVNEKKCTSKNVGKKNETTPGEQAQRELLSEFDAKLNEGYFRTIKEAEESVVILPMLAEVFEKQKHKIDWDNAIGEPKYDGMRAMALVNNGVTLKSRDGITIETLPHLVRGLARIKENCILNGELYAHGLTFQQNMKLIKKYREGETEQIKYRLYDIVSDEPYMTRLKLLGQLINKYNLQDICILTPFKKINNEEELMTYHIENTGAGYEGSMLRWGNKGYELDKRSVHLLKVKDFHDLALKIKDIRPADQRPEWGVPVFEWKGAKNDEVEAGMRYSHEERKEFLKNKDNYIGKIAELRFFEYTDAGVPRFPVMVGIRLDK